MKIKRDIAARLEREFNRKEISILLGPRQVGKTFLLNELVKIAKNKKLRFRYYNLELPSDTIIFNRPDAEIFEELTHNVDVVFIDEFHYIKNASKIFKAVFDSKKKVKIFASGSSSIEIHKHLKESLAGRRLLSLIYPLNYNEFLQTKNKNKFARYLVFGGMPGLTHYTDEDEKIRILNGILETYIQKDIKSLLKEENIRAFNTLLYLLAENQGSTIPVSNLSREIGLTANTISKYLSLLEQTFVIYPVSSYTKNMGNELKKSKKYYFFDTGIRNVILKDFGKPGHRDDMSILNKTFIFLQMRCHLKPNLEIKFWRNKQGQEIDFVLLKNRKPFLIEVKTNLNTPEIPGAFKIFIKNYPNTPGGIVFSNDLEGERDFQGKKIYFKKHEYIMEFITKIM